MNIFLYHHIINMEKNMSFENFFTNQSRKIYPTNIFENDKEPTNIYNKYNEPTKIVSYHNTHPSLNITKIVNHQK